MGIGKLLNQLRVESSNKIAVYTAATNSFDDIFEPKWQSSDIDYFLYTDNPTENYNNIWNIKKIGFTYRDPRRLAKIFKLFPHYLFPNYKYSIWIDANLEIKNNLEEVVEQYLDNNNYIAFFSHGKRTSIYEEADYCVRWGNDNKTIINNQINRYKKQGYDAKNGLIAGRFIVRKHNDTRCIKLMNNWWDEIDNHSVRDQLSFNYISWRNKLEYAQINLDQFHNKYFTINPHPRFIVYKDGGQSKVDLKILKSKLKHMITSSKSYAILKNVFLRKLFKKIGIQR